jgi:carboxyl-terminal processing protease
MLSLALFLLFLSAVLAIRRFRRYQGEQLYREILNLTAEHYLRADMVGLAWQDARAHRELRCRKEALVAANQALATLHDRNTYVLNRREARTAALLDRQLYRGIGVVINFGRSHPLITQVYPGTPAERSGLKIGQSIVSINGLPTLDRDPSELKRLLCGKRVRLTVEHKGVSTKHSLGQSKIRWPAVTARMLPSGFGYMRIAQFSGNTVNEASAAFTALENAKAIVLDLRDNPGGSLDCVLAMASFFIATGKIATATERLPGLFGPVSQAVTVFSLGSGHLTIEQTVAIGQAKPWVSLKPRHPYRLAGRRLAVLVNEASASAAELLAGAIKDNNAGTLIGRHTYGKGTAQIALKLPGNARLNVTTMSYQTPSGFCPGDGCGSGPGIAPHIEAANEIHTADGIISDRQLEVAVQLLSTQTAKDSQRSLLDLSAARMFALLRAS